MTIAQILVAFVAVFNLGGLVADGVVPSTARQHLRNPLWPPHAKFHNAQTMLMGIFSGALAFAILVLGGPMTLPKLSVAAFVAGNYFVSMALAPLFPGTAWSDPEFRGGARPLGLGAQQLVSYVLCALMIAALILAAI